MRKTTVAVVENCPLIQSAFKALINQYEEYTVVMVADNGKEFIDNLDMNHPPDILLIEANTPLINGYETAAWIRENCPRIRTILMSMDGTSEIVMKAVRAGVRGFVLKAADHPEALKAAFDSVRDSGYFLTEKVTDELVTNLQEVHEPTVEAYNPILLLTDREIDFLRLAASELTYKEIADKLNLSVRTVDGYRDTLFEKLQIKSRVGLAVFAIKHRIVQVRK